MILPKAPRVASPEQELRFTRSGQATWFWMGALACVAAAAILWTAGSGRKARPDRIHPLWAVPPAVAAWIAARAALRMTRHAYLILTPLGIEIFPFFRPAAGMRMVSWGEIAAAETDDALATLTLHFNGERNSGIHLSLAPIRPGLRPLLAKAVLARVSPPGQVTPEPPPHAPPFPTNPPR